MTYIQRHSSNLYRLHLGGQTFLLAKVHKIYNNYNSPSLCSRSLYYFRNNFLYYNNYSQNRNIVYSHSPTTIRTYSQQKLLKKDHQEFSSLIVDSRNSDSEPRTADSHRSPPNSHLSSNSHYSHSSQHSPSSQQDSQIQSSPPPTRRIFQSSSSSSPISTNNVCSHSQSQSQQLYSQPFYSQQQKFGAKTSTNHKNSATAPNLTSSLDYCADLVRRADYESYLCCLLLPAGVRFKAFVIRAFNCELSLLREQITNRQTGLGRLTFWSHGLNAVYNNTLSDTESSQNLHIPQQPVLIALNLILNHSSQSIDSPDQKNWRHFLPQEYFQHLIDARIKSVTHYDMSHETLTDLDEYGAKTFGACANLTLGLLKIDNDEARQAALYASQALAVINVLRSFYPLTRRNSLLLPLDVLRKHKVKPREAMRARFNDANTATGANLRQVARFLTEEAAQRLNAARNIRKKARLPTNSHYPLLFTTIIDHYLKLLPKIDYNLFDPILQAKNHWLPMQLWWKKIRRTF